MGEARRDSSSSLQHKKPPWLKLDIPAVVPPAAEEPSFLQVGPGQRGLRVQPVQCPHWDPVAQPLRRQAFLRSVSMPAEPARVPSPHQEPRRPVLQRQMSITQTIRRYWAVLAAWGGWGPGADAAHRVPSGRRAGSGAGTFSILHPRSPALGLAAVACSFLCPQHLLSPLCLPTQRSGPGQPPGALRAHPHSASLGPPAARRALPQRPSLSVPAQVPWAGQACAGVREREHGLCAPGAASVAGVPRAPDGRRSSISACMSEGRGQLARGCGTRFLGPAMCQAQLLLMAMLRLAEI